MENLLVVPEQRILLLSHLHGAAAILPITTLVSTSLFFILHFPFPHPRPPASPHYHPPVKAPTYLRNQHLIPRRHARRDPPPLLVQPPGPHRQHLRLVQLLDAALRQEDAARRLRLRFDALHENTVEERGEGFDRFEGGGLRVLVSCGGGNGDGGWGWGGGGGVLPWLLE